MKPVRYSIVLLLLFVFGCSRTGFKSAEECLAWMNKPENGLIKTKALNGMQLKMKYLPPHYLAWKEIKEQPSYTQPQRDSILRIYQNSLTFLFTISPDAEKGNEEDVMFKEISSYPEYSQRVYDMNFFFGEKMTLIAGDKEYKPVLAALENTYGIGPGRNIVLVFVPSEKDDNRLKTEEELVLKYEDDTYSLGTNRFVFQKKDIDNIPQLTFTNI